MESMYIHIPFCKSICSYCDFCKVLYHGPWIVKYLESLEKEIKNRYNGEVIKTLYIGGGTPSCLINRDLIKLMTIIKENVKLSEELEFTFECNLSDIDEQLLDVLKLYGVNRLSIGIESFNEKKLEFMERKCTYDEAEEKVKLIREKGFDNINFDLIYGIPNERVKDLKKDLELFLKLKPDHISTYSLIVEDNTKIAIKGIVPIKEDIDAKMYEYICEELDDKGYEHYEISNFCKNGKYSKHNLNCWNNEEYYGFGVGASGYIYGVRYDNTKSVTEYFKGNYLLRENFLSKEENMDNELMLGLRKIKGIYLPNFYKKFGVNIQDVYDLKNALKEKELIYKDDYLYVNPEYIYVMNEILIKIL